MSLTVGHTLGQYKILDKLGAGGMGVVYKAQDTRLGRLVALKVLPPASAEDAEAVERFRREARTASSLNHANICTIYSFDEQAGQLFLAMELLEGETLDTRLAAKALDLPELLELGIQIADALENAHSDGILHRDIKPANIFLTQRGQVKILDFGLAKLAPGIARRQNDPSPTEQFTSEIGTTVGTISYMSPEQARGEDLDPRTDLFSLGVVLFEMATGRQTFTGATTAVVFDGILNRDPATPSALNASVPPELDRIITKALEKDRELRYQTAADLRADLQRLRRDSGSRKASVALPVEELLATVVIQSRDSARFSVPASPWWSRHALVMVAVAALTLAVTLFGWTVTRGTDIGRPTALDAPAETMATDPPPPAAEPTLSAGIGTAISGGPLPDVGSAARTPAAGTTPDPPSAPSTPGIVSPPTVVKSGEAAALDRLAIARVKLNSNLQEQALADLRQIFIDFPSSAAAAEASFLSAEILEQLGRLEDAMAAHIEFNQRFSKDRRLAASKLRLAQLTLRSRQPQREETARTILGDIATAHPKTAESLAALQTKLRLEQGRGPREVDPVLGVAVPRALPTLRAIAEQFPRSPVAMIALNRLAELYGDIGDYPRAAETYTRLATNFPQNPNDAWFRAGEIYERRLKDLPTARELYSKVPKGSARYKDAQRKLK